MKEEFDFYSKTTLKSYNLDETMRYQLSMLDTLDPYTRLHCENVANITCRLCEYMGIDKDFTVYCTICAYLHDLGKLSIPPSILQKNGPLTDEEYEIMKTHTTLGYNACMEDPKLRPYAAGTIYHHEALNGSGYPKGLTKKNIPIEGQIIRVADEFDAIVSKRQYKTHIGITDTLKLLIEETKPYIPKSVFWPGDRSLWPSRSFFRRASRSSQRAVLRIPAGKRLPCRVLSCCGETGGSEMPALPFPSALRN